MKTENLFNMFNALLALELSEKMQTPQTPQTMQTMQTMQTQNTYDLGAQIEALTKAVQSNAIMHSEQPKAMTADEALAAIINPPQKGSEK